MRETLLVKSIDLGKAYRLLYPKTVVIATVITEDGKPNAITLAWCMPLSAQPPLVSISIAPSRYSYQLLKQVPEFVINVPTTELLQTMWICGTVSGRTTDKLSLAKVTLEPSKRVRPPRIQGCAAYLECRVVNELETGDHVLFVGEVVHAEVDERLFDSKSARYNTKFYKPILQIGGPLFTTTSQELLRPR